MAKAEITNIKNLPEGRNYFTEYGYSQSYPWVEISRTAKTVTLAKVIVKDDPEWLAKKEFYPGGFVGHVPNQREQTWIFDRIEEGCTRTVRKVKKFTGQNAFNEDGDWGYQGVRFVEGRAVEFYDYNF